MSEKNDDQEHVPVPALRNRWRWYGEQDWANRPDESPVHFHGTFRIIEVVKEEGATWIKNDHDENWRAVVHFHPDVPAIGSELVHEGGTVTVADIEDHNLTVLTCASPTPPKLRYGDVLAPRVTP